MKEKPDFKAPLKKKKKNEELTEGKQVCGKPKLRFKDYMHLALTQCNISLSDCESWFKKEIEWKKNESCLASNPQKSLKSRRLN